MAEDRVIGVKQARELHLQERRHRRHALLQNAGDAREHRHKLHGRRRGEGVRPLQEECHHPPDLPQIEIRRFAIGVGRGEEGLGDGEGNEGGGGGEDGRGGREEAVQGDVTDDSSEEEEVALGGVGALGLGERPEVPGDVG